MTQFPKLLIFLGILLGGGVVGNLIWLDWKISQISQISQIGKTETIIREIPVAATGAAQCNCPAPIIATPSTIIKTVTNTVTAPSKIREFYVPLGSGTTAENDKWVDIYGAQATVNTDNYPGIKTAYFEVVMHVPNGQGELKAKLLETTLPFSYGEILRTQSGTGQLVSTPIVLQKGNRNYRVQLNNQIGTGILDSARIRIVTE